MGVPTKRHNQPDPPPRLIRQTRRKVHFATWARLPWCLSGVVRCFPAHQLPMCGLQVAISPFGLSIECPFESGRECGLYLLSLYPISLIFFVCRAGYRIPVPRRARSFPHTGKFPSFFVEVLGHHFFLFPFSLSKQSLHTTFFSLSLTHTADPVVTNGINGTTAGDGYRHYHCFVQRDEASLYHAELTPAHSAKQNYTVW